MSHPQFTIFKLHFYRLCFETAGHTKVKKRLLTSETLPLSGKPQIANHNNDAVAVRLSSNTRNSLQV